MGAVPEWKGHRAKVLKIADKAFVRRNPYGYPVRQEVSPEMRQRIVIAVLGMTLGFVAGVGLMWMVSP